MRSDSDRPTLLSRAMLVLAALIFGTLLSFLSLSQAHAGAIGCRTDPNGSLANSDAPAGSSIVETMVDTKRFDISRVAVSAVRNLTLPVRSFTKDKFKVTLILP